MRKKKAKKENMENIDSNLRPQRRSKGPGHRAEGEGEGPEGCGESCRVVSCTIRTGRTESVLKSGWTSRMKKTRLHSNKNICEGQVK